jgi:amino acid adenylation domain-containing protein
MAATSATEPELALSATSYAQRSLWFLDQLAPGTSLYNLHTSIPFGHEVDVEALRRSLDEVVRRHDSLRTAFRGVGGEPVQVVSPSLHIPLPITDLSHLADGEREDQALGVATAEAEAPFELTRLPLLRARLVTLAYDDHVLLLTMHHIVSDYWSLEIFQAEVLAVYEAYCSGLPSPLPPSALQYPDFAAWEREWLRGPSAAAQLEYWKGQLAGVEHLELPTDRPRPSAPSFEGADADFRIAPAVHAALKGLSRQENATLFMTTLAAFQTLLHRYSGQRDVVVGTPVANRARSQFEGIIGFFVNSVAMRADFTGNPTFRELLRRVRSVVLDAFVHQELPFERLVSELRPDRRQGGNPLFQVHFQLFTETSALGGDDPVDSDFMAVRATAAKFDLALDLSDAPDALWGHLEYTTDLWTPDTIGRLARHFSNLLAAIAADPDQPVSELSLIDRAERRRLLETWNATEVTDNRDRCLHYMFEAQVERAPERTALVCGEELISYRQLDERADRLAAYLTSLGLGPESLAAVCAERSIEFVVSVLGVLKAGAAYIPLNPSDPPERLKSILDDALPELVLTVQAAADSLPTGGLRRVRVDAEWTAISGAGTTGAPSDLDPESLAYVIYTSGSTGSPKGVQVAHRSVCNHLRWMQAALPMGVTDRALLKYPVGFDASVYELFGPLLAGATVFITQVSTVWDIAAFVRQIRDARITLLDLVPSMLEVLLDDPEFAACGSVRRVAVGGEELTSALCARFRAVMNAELHNIYGPTEATIGATTWSPGPAAQPERVPIGRPGWNTQIYVLDPNMNPVPIGVVGELYIGGECLARGYVGRPALTAERFVPDPFSRRDGGRLYRTGDLARWGADGSIYYAGRLDDQIKLRGYRIEPAEVEATLSRHESVRACAVVPVVDPQGRKRLVAHVVPAREPPELWPSLGEYDVYDDLLYYAMTHDERRTEAYRSGISKAVPGKIVLDLGTGADAVLARLCAAAGAAKVYALERGDDAFAKASALVESLGLSGEIEVIRGDSSEVALPELVDVCVSEVFGTIGSSEGVISILNDARRLLKPEGMMIPRRCVTRFAPATLPPNLAGSLGLAPLPRFYVERVFERAGRPFDLRMCIKNARREDLLSSPQVFEALDFASRVAPGEQHGVTFTIDRHARMDGFLLWLNLYADDAGGEQPLDSLTQSLSWLPVFFPVFYPGVPVVAGDALEVTCARRPSVGGRFPDYTVTGVVVRQNGERVQFDYASPAGPEQQNGHSFYRALFATLDRDGAPGAGDHGSASSSSMKLESLNSGTSHSLPLATELRRFVESRAPAYMVPSAFVVRHELPRNASGKLDRRALVLDSERREHAHQKYVAPISEAERLCVTAWQEVLDVERIGVDDNFFDLGGDSLLLTQARVRLRTFFHRDIPIVELFRYPTVGALARYLQQGQVQTGLRQEADDRERKRREAMRRRQPAHPPRPIEVSNHDHDAAS